MRAEDFPGAVRKEDTHIIPLCSDTKQSYSAPLKSTPVEDRQRLTTSKALVTHPPEITDSFTLYIKSSILLGKVKTFNGRFKLKYESTAGAGDPMETTEFQMLDSAIQKFKASIPKDLCQFISLDGKVDPTLHMALLVPNV